jgi:hypothetical protein
MSNKTEQRSAAVAALVAILLVVILAFVSFGVDMGWIVLVQSQLQNAADAAAMAGASELSGGPFTWNGYSSSSQTYTLLDSLINDASALTGTAPTTNSQVGAAQSGAQATAGYNTAGGQAVSLATSDISVGYTNIDASGGSVTVGTNIVAYGGYLDYTSSAPYTSSSAQVTTGIYWANTVKVTVRRDGTNGTTALPLFFAPIMGINTEALYATATAQTNIVANDSNNTTNYNNTVSFSSYGNGSNGTLLPVAIRVSDWKSFLDTYQSNDGARFSIYKTNPSNPGNFGDVALYNQNIPNSNGPLETWIVNGPSPSDLATFDTGNINSSTNGGLKAGMVMSGEPGLRDTLKSYYQQIVGERRIIPLYDYSNTDTGWDPSWAAAATNITVSGNGGGNNAEYHIVGFAGIQLTDVTGDGSTLSVSVIPVDTSDPTLSVTSTSTTTTSGGSSGSTPYTYLNLSGWVKLVK